MDNKQSVLNFLGIAKRAGKIVTGQDIILSNIKKNKVYFLFIAKDSGQSTIKKFNDKAKFYQVPVNNNLSKDEISSAIGAQRTMIGITDRKMSQKLSEIV
ncbi:L7Ae/L30e/S12e/Gadd45 family ribosomal protein [Lentilactobacillus laojiaonis]|uniref:L7Ae/L30e/S12e/Gadd45 family ribosomal protein n=1 Tax=Lentilactobacillus laojiaonis TaxID=2883998 RepID=UPI001D0AF758|nr:ribosomal L7Ae/L30e/S12e/Gadd45 family protein [Lentilactobacillus laojiaonis]UDM31652.1 ribosomal L7Ae/L30e/S12e/Gadd45 family protein [Lentilactobacillus laojiaonis]